MLDRLRALAKAESPPVHEVENWYSRLDQMVDTCSTEDSEKIRKAFRLEKLILTQNGVWEVAPAVFLESDEEDVPDAEVIRASVNALTLWRKIGVADRPTSELAIKWLQSLPVDKVVKQEEARVRSLLKRYPARIWEECRYWLNLAGEWASVDGLSYSLTTQSPLPWGHLHPWVKQKTADLCRLPPEITGNPPFSQLPTLATHVEERFDSNRPPAGVAVTKEWLTVLGQELCRIKLDTEDDTRRVRGLADNLARTGWHETPGLLIIPYIDGTPAGTPRQAEVLWLNDVLYVDRLPKAKLARRVPEEIGKAFGLGHTDIKAALDYSFERPEQDVRDYLEENFTLCRPANALPAETSVKTEPDPTSGHEEPGEPVGAGAGQEPGEAESSSVENVVEPEGGETEDTGTTGTDAEQETDTVVIKPPRPRPSKPAIIERYAKSQGFRKDSDVRFFHEDGSWIARASGGARLFPWEHHAASGDLVRYYWPRDHCLEHDPLQLEADVWRLIEQHPETYVLVLADIKGNPVEVTGSRLCAMIDKGEVTPYPATHRFVYDRNSHA